jgi:DNA-binding XRE family transcriptional regulator
MKLKNHERLMIARKRAGLTQLQAAARAGVSYRAYLALEQGPLTNERLEALERQALHFKLSTDGLTAGERCLIMRLRVRRTQADVAKDLGCCRRWVMLMEKGLAPADTLVWYWEQ